MADHDINLPDRDRCRLPRRSGSSRPSCVVNSTHWDQQVWASRNHDLHGAAAGIAVGLGPLAVVSLLAVIACLGLALVLFLRERHHRRRLGDLLDRLARFEETWQGASVPDEGERRSALEPVERFLGWPRGPLSSLISALGSGAAEELPSPERIDYNAIRVLYSRIEERTTPTDLAAELNMSLRTLQRGLAKALDCTPSELIIAVTMREAKRRLVVEGLQVQEVARSLGFDNPFYFSSRFKAYYRVAPSEVRRAARGKAS